MQHKIKGAPAEDAPVSLSETSLLHSVTQQRQLIVDYTQQTQQYDTCTAETQTESHGSVATERSDRSITLVDEHGLYHQQIVVKRNNRIDQGDQDQNIVSLFGRCRKDEELAEESGKGRDTRQREHG